MRNVRATLVLLLGGAVLAACAAGDSRFTADEPAGFWYGLWHGAIAIVALVVGLFSDHVEIYERANTGGWYDLGFLIGVLSCSGSAHRSHRAWGDRSKARALPPSGRLEVDVTWTAADRAGKAPASRPATAARPAATEPDPAATADEPDDRTG